MQNVCSFCNRLKGPNVAGYDPVTKRLTKLYNPRRHKWAKHFRLVGPYLVGRTPVGRTTILVLSLNNLDLVQARKELMEEGGFPR